MSRFRLFLTMAGRDFRIMMRDPQHLFGMGALLFSLIFVGVTFRFARESDREPRKETRKTLEETRKKLDDIQGTVEGEDPEAGESGERQKTDEAAVGVASPDVVRWSVIFGIGLLGFFGSFFAVPLALASFAGEKEEGTLEILLATPISDLTLYILKLASIVAVTAVFGYLHVFLGVGLGFWVFNEALAGVPTRALVVGGLASLPLPAFLLVLQVGIGALCSVRADTTKGAGQIFGGLTSIFFLGGPVAFLIIGQTSWKGTFLRFAQWWWEFGFFIQLASLYGLLFLLCLVVAGVGALLFKRDRLIG